MGARSPSKIFFHAQKWFFATRALSLEAQGALVAVVAVQVMHGSVPPELPAARVFLGNVSDAAWAEIRPMLVPVLLAPDKLTVLGIGLEWVALDVQRASKYIDAARKSGRKGGRKSAAKREETRLRLVRPDDPQTQKPEARQATP